VHLQRVIYDHSTPEITAAKIWLLFDQCQRIISQGIGSCSLVPSGPITQLPGPDLPTTNGVKNLKPHKQTIEITSGRA